ncbi:MAG: hypothetical protein K6F05_03865 [Succinivibrio sp.]|nr:hypothetical protein [Succinivibrio sp.]
MENLNLVTMQSSVNIDSNALSEDKQQGVLQRQQRAFDPASASNPANVSLAEVWGFYESQNSSFADVCESVTVLEPKASLTLRCFGQLQ